MSWILVAALGISAFRLSQGPIILKPFSFLIEGAGLSGTLPNFIIIGAAKSGTTTLFRHLRSHPDVFLAPGKEIHYFDDQFHKGLGWYKGHFCEVADERAIGEATPGYMYFEEAPMRMAEVVPDAKLIAILRNPVDRAYSHYWHERVRGREKLEFADAIAAEPERLADGEQRSLHYYSYGDRGRYVYQLQRVCQFYPRESLLVLLLEELHDTPLESVHSAYRFLGVDDSFIPPNLGAVYHRQVPARSLKLRAITRRIPPLHRLIDPLNTPASSNAAMNPGVRAELVKVFEEDNAALASWLGRDLSAWNE